jgi:hypothetical protein
MLHVAHVGAGLLIGGSSVRVRMASPDSGLVLT